MLKNRLSVFAVAGTLALAACGGGEQPEGEVISADTTMTTVTDTALVPMETTDTVATTTTTTVTADTTITTDTMHTDTAAHP